VLRGAGVVMALPWMESLVTRSAFAAPKMVKPPVRSAFIFFPNGVVPTNWTPKGDGEQYELTPMLKSLKDVKNDYCLLEELWHEDTVGRNGHWAKVPAWLSGGFVERGIGKDIDTGGTSVDQWMADRIGHRTMLPSFELGIEPPRTGIDSAGGGFPRMVGSHISWRDPHTPVQKEIIPRSAFDRLFRTSAAFPKVKGIASDSRHATASLQRDDASVLDLVLDDAKSLQKRVSNDDRVKLDEYLESVRSVERRIQTSATPGERWHNDDSFRLDRPAPGIPQSHQEHVRLMMDIMLLAFWTDTTRICTFMMAQAQSGLKFNFLDGVSDKHYHGLSHHRENKEVRDEYERIATWHIKQFAWLLEKMRTMDEGGHGSLLDNSMILFGSSIKDGNRHTEKNLPLILAGKGGGLIRPGRRVRSKKDTPLCNLLLTMGKGMGLDAETFGDSNGLMTGLS
jgi:hypothetical protein